jgi:hypothetical protein
MPLRAVSVSRERVAPRASVKLRYDLAVKPLPLDPLDPEDCASILGGNLYAYALGEVVTMFQPRYEETCCELPKSMKINLVLEPLLFAVSHLEARAGAVWRGRDLVQFMTSLNDTLPMLLAEVFFTARQNDPEHELKIRQHYLQFFTIRREQYRLLHSGWRGWINHMVRRDAYLDSQLLTALIHNEFFDADAPAPPQLIAEFALATVNWVYQFGSQLAASKRTAA